jgi:hypothetical protein
MFQVLIQGCLRRRIKNLNFLSCLLLTFKSIDFGFKAENAFINRKISLKFGTFSTESKEHYLEIKN